MWLRKSAHKLAAGLALIVVCASIVTGWWIMKERAFTALAKNVYWEALAANEPELSARMVAYVTVQRAKADKKYWGGLDIYDVVYARKQKGKHLVVCQFSWTCMQAANQEPKPGPKWELAKRIAGDQLAGKFTPPINLAGATSYLNPAHSGRHNLCEFQTRLILLGKAEPESHHVFYRDAVGTIDKKVLPKEKDVVECKPSLTKKKTVLKGPG